MRVITSLFTLALVALFAAPEASAQGPKKAKKDQWGAIAVGDHASTGALLQHFCIDRDTQAEAETCARDKFVAQGGGGTPTIAPWNCKGYLAIAEDKGAKVVGLKTCAANAEQAKTEAVEQCKSKSGTACVVTVTVHDPS
jgi:hypothetical protein